MSHNQKIYSNEYDSMYRIIFEDPRIFAQFVREFALNAVSDLLDLSSLKRVQTRHVSESLRQSESDMIWELRTRDGGLLYVYVMLEFQARPDWTMPLRMANYVGQFYRGLLSRPEIRKLRRLPQVLPLVIYSGKPTWTAPPDVNELLDRTLPDLLPYGLRMRYLLVDVWRTHGLDRALRNVPDSVFRLQRAESLEEGLNELRLLEEWLAGEEWAGLRRVLETWIMKVLLPTELQSELSSEAGLRELSETLEGDMRSWEDNFREAAEAKGHAEGHAEGRTEGHAEGRAEGRTEGRAEVLLNMVRHKFGEKSAAEVATALSGIQTAEALDKVTSLLLTCESGNALLAGVREC